jgi:hypothetical protein
MPCRRGRQSTDFPCKQGSVFAHLRQPGIKPADANRRAGIRKGRPPLQYTGPQLVWVSEVVVVTGAGTVVCEDVVVVLDEGVEAQADSDTRTAATKQGRRIFFTGWVVVLIVFCEVAMITRSVGRMLWGVELTHSRRPSPTGVRTLSHAWRRIIFARRGCIPNAVGNPRQLDAGPRAGTRTQGNPESPCQDP